MDHASKHLGFELVATSVIWSGSASAKPAQCFLSVDGKTNIDKLCNADFEKDGSFTIGAGETSQSEREIRNG
jgi:hypothetical protein